MRRFLKKIGRSLKGALGKGSQPRAGMAAEAMKGGFDPSKIMGGRSKIRGGGFGGVIKRAAAAAQKAGATGAKPKAGLGSGIGATRKRFGGGFGGVIKRAAAAAAAKKAGAAGAKPKDDEKDEKMDAKPFENGGAVKKASSKGRGMGAATQGGGAVGGAAKKKGYAMGGMAMKKGYAAGGPAMKKGYAMGGAAMKKGYASGGSARSK